VLFRLGPTAAFGTTFPAQVTSGAGAGSLTQVAGGLAPSKQYFWGVAGTDGVRTTAAGPTQSFTTLATPTAVVVQSLALKPATFRAAASGPIATATRHRIGSTGTYSQSGHGTAHFTIQRIARGFRKAGRCVGTRPPGKVHRCTRFVKVATFELTADGGTHSFALSGRAKGRKLRPGRYRLTAIGDPNTAIRKAGFKIVRR
jgi:hypothetical protein